MTSTDGAGPSDGLLDLIYDAAADDRLWVPALEEIAKATNSVAGVLLCQSIRDRTIFFEHHTNTSEECLRVLKERHQGTDKGEPGRRRRRDRSAWKERERRSSTNRHPKQARSDAWPDERQRQLEPRQGG